MLYALLVVYRIENDCTEAFGLAVVWNRLRSRPNSNALPLDLISRKTVRYRTVRAPSNTTFLISIALRSLQGLWQNDAGSGHNPTCYKAGVFSRHSVRIHWLVVVTWHCLPRTVHMRVNSAKRVKLKGDSSPLPADVDRCCTWKRRDWRWHDVVVRLLVRFSVNVIPWGKLPSNRLTGISQWMGPKFQRNY